MRDNWLICDLVSLKSNDRRRVDCRGFKISHAFRMSQSPWQNTVAHKYALRKFLFHKIEVHSIFKVSAIFREKYVLTYQLSILFIFYWRFVTIFGIIILFENKMFDCSLLIINNLNISSPPYPHAQRLLIFFLAFSSFE